VVNPNDSWRRSMLPAESTIYQAIDCLDRVGLKIVLVTSPEGVLLGTISDGDVRRGLLKGLSLDSPITEVMWRSPLVVPIGLSLELVHQLMVANKVHQIPVVDDEHRMQGLHLWNELVTPQVRPNLMVIMAGGKGTRLRPQTENCPKPLLEVAGKPILEHIIERAKLEGFYRFLVAVHYLGHMIEDYFGDGRKLGVDIQYLREESPLGTAGALSLMQTPPEEPFVVTNGDVLTDIRYGELVDFHSRNHAKATMAVRAHEWQHPFGVVQLRGLEVIGFEEKPIVKTHINAGVYVLEPSVLGLLSPKEVCDMPTLFERLQGEAMRTVAYPMHEPWMDIGRIDDLNNANQMNGSNNALDRRNGL
jgi:dTDP-glucose pyrophosphorylase